MRDWQEIAVPLVAQFEGCARKGSDGLIHPYLDKLPKPPLWTRGYGRTYGIDGASPAISKEQALAELRQGLTDYAARCLKLAPSLATRPECLAAVTSWAWNCGVGAFKVSRLRRAINAGQWTHAAQLITRPRTSGGVEVKGLARRRDAEAAVFAGNLEPAGS